MKTCFNDKPLVSILTVVYNGERFIEDAVKSVINQEYCNLEYIVIDGASTDGTIHKLKKYKKYIKTLVSEPDNGIYDAMNKGIALASGHIIGILNSDDFYIDNTIVGSIVNVFKNRSVDCVFADLVIVDQFNTEKVHRYYKSSAFHSGKFAYGWMPAHPTCFIKRICYEKYGMYKTNYKIAADYELLVRLLALHRISYSYLDKVIIKMRSGGVSTRNLKSNWLLNKEIIYACRDNGIPTNMFKVLSKYPRKIFQLISRPKTL